MSNMAHHVQTKIVGEYEEVKVNFIWKARSCICRIIFSSLKLQKLLSLSHFHLLPYFHTISILFWKNPLAQHPNTSPPTPPNSHKSRTPLAHHLVPFYFTISTPGATDPRPKHQASAPSLPILLPYKSISVRALLTFNASARACGRKRCQTMSNMRTFNAICDNIQPCPLPHNYNWNQQTAEAKIARKYEEIRVNFSWKDVLSSAYWMGMLLWLWKCSAHSTSILLLSYVPMWRTFGKIHWPNTRTPVHQHN